MDGERRGEGKTRTWAFVMYPESAPENWREILDGMHVRALVSPLHDRDVNPGGEPKKPHWHVLLMFDGPVRKAYADSLADAFNGTKSAEKVASTRGYARYLCHLDNPEKAQYDPGEVEAFGGADYALASMGEAEAVNAALDDIEEFIDTQGIVSYRALCQYARAERPEWTRVIRTHTVHLMAYVRSADWEARGGCDGRPLPPE